MKYSDQQDNKDNKDNNNTNSTNSTNKPNQTSSFNSPFKSTNSSIKMRSAIFISAISLLPAALAAPVEISARGCVGPDVNPATIALIKEFEGFVPSPAPDPVGLPTVGYGHLCQSKNCGEVGFPFPLTEDTATQLLIRDVKVCIPSQAPWVDV